MYRSLSIRENRPASDSSGKNVTEVVLHLHLFLHRVQPYNRGNFVFSCRQECLTATSTRLATGQFEPKLLKNYKEHMLYL